MATIYKDGTYERMYNNDGFRSGVMTLNKALTRLNSTKDPMIRYHMFVDVIWLGMDMGLTYLQETKKDEFADIEHEIMALENRIAEWEHPMDGDSTDHSKEIRDGKARLVKLRRAFRNLERGLPILDEIVKQGENYMNGFSEWVRQPIYSPDHPYGRNMANQSEADFKDRSVHQTQTSTSINSDCLD